MDSEIERACITQLHKIVSLWPTETHAAMDTVQPALRNMMTNDFDRTDLLNEIHGVKKILETLVSGDDAAIEFIDTESCHQKAVFKRIESGEWKLQSLKFQCPACFGSGINNESECKMCDGAGWGAA
jgi:hypothetical protein